MAVLATSLIASSSGAVSVTLPTMDLLALRSDRIAVLVVDRSADSLDGFRTLEFHVMKSLRGQAPVSPMRLDNWKDQPALHRGDTLLWLRELSVHPEVEDTERYEHVFDLSDLRRSPFELALTRDFGVLHEGTRILTIVEKRLRMAQAAKPLGDERSLSLVDFAQGRGTITRQMPYKSEAQKATDGGSINRLSYPADAELLPEIMRESYGKVAWLRAAAAEALANYPGEATTKRLTELLADPDTSMEIRGPGNGEPDTVWVHFVRRAAAESLRQLGVPVEQGRH